MSKKKKCGYWFDGRTLEVVHGCEGELMKKHKRLKGDEKWSLTPDGYDRVEVKPFKTKKKAQKALEDYEARMIMEEQQHGYYAGLGRFWE